MNRKVGQKLLKEIVSIFNDDNKIRLRWTYEKQRYSLNLFKFSKENIKQAKRIALIIEEDMDFQRFDCSLKRYKALKELGIGHQGLTVGASLNNTVSQLHTEAKVVDLAPLFETWAIGYRHIKIETNYHYKSSFALLLKWKDVTSENVVYLLNNENLKAKSYNHKIMVFTSFFGWLKKKRYVTENPFEDVVKRKVPKKELRERKPFTEDEIHQILEAFKYDTFCQSSVHKHSAYYPFLYFLFATGCRPAEAIGLRTSSIDFDNSVITISEALARVLNKTNSASRIRKSTKNGKTRQIPMGVDLAEILKPLVVQKQADDLVFQTQKGNCIDDRAFTKRVFKKVLVALNIEYRILYACRHTFNSRCIEAGISPVQSAFLLGNNPETALRNYTHQISLPKELPSVK